MPVLTLAPDRHDDRAKLPLRIFVRVDSEGKTLVLAQELLPNEQTPSFEFVLENFIDLCRGAHPKVRDGTGAGSQIS